MTWLCIVALALYCAYLRIRLADVEHDISDLKTGGLDIRCEDPSEHYHFEGGEAQQPNRRSTS